METGIITQIDDTFGRVVRVRIAVLDEQGEACLGHEYITDGEAWRNGAGDVFDIDDLVDFEVNERGVLTNIMPTGGFDD